MLKIENVSVEFLESSDKFSISNISFTLNDNSCLLLVGANGSGKTTVLKYIADVLDKKTCKTSGKIDGIDNKDKPIYLPADSDLFSNITAYECMCLGLSRGGKKSFDIRFYRSKSVRGQVEKFYNDNFQGQFGLDDKAGALSSGQRKLLILSAIFINPSPIVLLDEPTAHLDLHNRQIVARFIKSIQEKEKFTLVIATHHEEVVDVFEDSKMLRLVRNNNTSMVNIDVNTSKYKRIYRNFVEAAADNWIFGEVVNEIEEKYLKDIKNKKVLVAGCGIGREVKYLLEQGNDITCVDISPKMASKCRDRFGDKMKVFVADMTKLDSFFLNDSFDCIVCIGNTVGGLLSQTEFEGFMRSSKKVLRENGTLVIDFTVASTVNKEFYSGEIIDGSTSSNGSFLMEINFNFGKTDSEKCVQRYLSDADFLKTVSDTEFKVLNREQYEIGWQRGIANLSK